MHESLLAAALTAAAFSTLPAQSAPQGLPQTDLPGADFITPTSTPKILP